MAVPLSTYLNVGSPIWELHRAYLQNQRLGNLLSLAASETSITCRIQLLTTIYRETEANLASALYQLGMPKFLDDVDRYLYQLQMITSPRNHPSYVAPFEGIYNHTPSASSSPLTPAELIAVE